MQKWNKSRRNIWIKKVRSVVLTGLLAVSMVNVTVVETKADDISLQNPRVENGVSFYDYVYFGSYPQAEVIPSLSENAKTTVGPNIRNGNDYVVDESIYQYLQNATGWDQNGDITYMGKKYRRLRSSDSILPEYVTSYDELKDSCSYNWSAILVSVDEEEDEYEYAVDSTTYHYFQYQPIKWRVLEVADGKSLLLAEQSLDAQLYNTGDRGDVWKNSTLRSFLNSYNSSMNVNNEDYSSKGFFSKAFDKEEQAAICNMTIESSTNSVFGTDGGGDTEDRIFLLSEEDVYGENAAKHGFSSDNSDMDSARRAKSTTYAKAKGCYNWFYGEYKGNSSWMLRTPGAFIAEVEVVEGDGSIDPQGYEIIEPGNSVRPALWLDLSCEDVYSTTAPSEDTKHEHSYTSEVSRKATCVDKGIRTFTCTCGDSYTEDIAVDSENHVGDTELRDVKAATATANGYTGDKYCKACGAKIAEGSIIPATGNSGSQDTGKTTEQSSVTATASDSSVNSQKQIIKVAKIPTYKMTKIKKNVKVKLKAQAKGKLTYKVIKYPKNCKKYISVSKKGVVTLKKGIKKGNYKIAVTAAATEGYEATTKIITIKVQTKTK